MLAMNRLLNGAWQVLEGAFGGHGLIPTHAVMKRFSSISVGTETLFGLLKLVVKAVAVAVSLNAGRVGITGFEEEPLLYSKIAVVVALSNFLVHLHKLVQLCSIELVVVFLEAKNKNYFIGAKIGVDKVPISHLQYADDALFIGQWSLANANNLSSILICFHLAFGFKVNFNKSRLYGIGVHTNDLNLVASAIDFQPSQLPCTYLGLPIGSNMSRCSNWCPLIDRFKKRLSRWKSKTLSLSGRLTLIKFVLNSLCIYYFSTFKALVTNINKLESIRRNLFWGGISDDRKIAWVAWDKVLAPHDQGGLNIRILKVFNQDMQAK
ncbi:hypothetical protein Tco_0265766 [Tanacetum coccineum]